jgi:hypothetical protein
MPGTGASAPAITSAAATRKVEERRECRIARSPEVPNADVSAGFSPLYGKKKGGFGEPRAQKNCGQRCLVGGYVRPPQCIGLKAQEKSGSGRGANAAGAAR